MNCYTQNAADRVFAAMVRIRQLLYFSSALSTAFGAAATANFEQEWSKLITAAQQEGTLSIASGGAPSRQYRPVVDAFSKKFNIKVEVSTGNATDTVNRVLAERKGRQVHRRRGVDQLARKSAALGAIRLAGAACRRCCFIPTSSTLSKWYKGDICTPTSSASSH